MPASSALGHVVGVEDYEAAGGKVERDLFAANDERGVYLVDVELVERLADAKLQKVANDLMGKWRWAAVERNIDHNRLHSMHRVQASSEGPTEVQAAKLEALTKERKTLEDAHADDYEAAGGDARYNAVEHEVNQLEREIAMVATYRESDRKVAVCIVTLSPQGEIVVHSGLVRAEDVQALLKPAAPAVKGTRPNGKVPGETPGTQARAPERGPAPETGEPDATDPDSEEQAAPEPPPVVIPPTTSIHGGNKEPDADSVARKEAGVGISLSEDLCAVRTELIKAHLVNNPTAAFDLLAFHLVSSTIARTEYHDPALGITTNARDSQPYSASDPTRQKAIDKTLGTYAKWETSASKTAPGTWRKQRSRRKKFEAFCGMTMDEKMALLARVVAVCLNGQLAFEPTALPDVETTVEHLGIDFAELARPSAALYWSRITKERMLQIASETLGSDWAEAHRGDKKTELADALHTAFKKSDGTPKGVTAEGRANALRWAMPGFAAFDETGALNGASEEPSENKMRRQ